MQNMGVRKDFGKRSARAGGGRPNPFIRGGEKKTNIRKTGEESSFRDIEGKKG